MELFGQRYSAPFGIAPMGISALSAYRGDLVQSAVVTERMRSGSIESMRIPGNPLDVLLSQQASRTRGLAENGEEVGGDDFACHLSRRHIDGSGE